MALHDAKQEPASTAAAVAANRQRRGAVHRMSTVSLEDQLLSLSPKSKLVVGIVLALGGAGACVLLWQRGWIVGWAVLATIIGLFLAAVGRREVRRHQAIEGERSRARREWNELVRAIQAARREGQSVARFLQARGYREFEVRRWIAKELGAGAGDEWAARCGTGADRRPSGARGSRSMT